MAPAGGLELGALARARVGGELRGRSIADAGARRARPAGSRAAAPGRGADGAPRGGRSGRGLRAVADAALARAYGESPVVAETRTGIAARRALAAASAAADELAAALPGAGGDDVLAALDAIQVRLGDGLPQGRVRIVRIGLARLAPVPALVLCGLEDGVLPRREPAEAAGSAELRRALTPAGPPR